jgi:tellurite resistance protein
MLFGIGLSGWALLEARILSRLFEGPMPEPLRPTIGVELAPPAIATLAASSIWPQLPPDALLIGLGVAIAPFVGVMARYRWWSQVPFSVGFWSFSFPLAALAGAVIEAVHRGSWPAWIGIVALLTASAAIAFLGLQTLVLLLQGRFLPKE